VHKRLRADQLGQAKVGDLDERVGRALVEQNVLRLEVAVHHALRVQVLHCQKELPEVKLGGWRPCPLVSIGGSDEALWRVRRAPALPSALPPCRSCLRVALGEAGARDDKVKELAAGRQLKHNAQRVGRVKDLVDRHHVGLRRR
jgi:hypothetical protein